MSVRREEERRQKEGEGVETEEMKRENIGARGEKWHGGTIERFRGIISYLRVAACGAAVRHVDES